MIISYYFHSMESLKLCRLCLAHPAVSFSLLESNGTAMLESVAFIKISKDDKLPKRVCVKCWLNLKLAYQIQQNIIECDKKLKLFYVEEETNSVDTEISSTSMDIKQEHVDFVHKTDPEVDSEYADSIVDNSEFDLSKDNINLDDIKIESIAENKAPFCIDESNTENSDVDEKELIKKVSVACHICGMRFEENVLIDHLKTHYSSRLQCDECNTYCENIASYKTHISLNHKDMQESWTCTICGACFKYKPLYKIHTEQAHADDVPPRRRRSIFCKSILQAYKFDCPYCTRKFKTEQASLTHIKTHNKKECPVCRLEITPSNFKVHVDSHTASPIVCHLCGMTYKNKTSLRSHIYYTHSTRQYTCKHCGKVFKKAYDLPLHIKKEHTGQKDHTCDVCGKSFYAFHNLNKHKKTTHMKLRPFPCQYCKKSFSSKHALRTHVRQHTNDTPYKCDVCGEGFRQNVSLRSHKKSKHNIIEIKTFPCSTCGKKFGSKWAVLSHMRVH